MGHATDQCPTPPSPAQPPQPNRILAEPANVNTCRADYEQGADVRQRLNMQIRGGR